VVDVSLAGEFLLVDADALLEPSKPSWQQCIRNVAYSTADGQGKAQFKLETQLPKQEDSSPP